MSIGAGIALLVIGAILAFAIDASAVPYVDVRLIGYILMAAGALIFVIGLVLMVRGRRSESVTSTTADGQRTIRRDVDGT